MSFQYRELRREGGIDEKGVRHYTRTFQVITSNGQDGPGTVSSYVPINLYASYITPTETDLYAILKKKDAKPVDGELGVWEVTCEYDSAPFDKGTQNQTEPGQGNNQTTPTARPWVLKFGSNKTTKLLAKDLNNKDVAASNGQPFDPPLEIPAANPTIQITAFKAGFSFATIPYYMNAINSDAWQGFAPKKLRCVEYGATTQYENGSFFWQVDLTLEVNADDFWNPVKILDAGTLTRSSMSKPPQPILDSTGNPISSPVPLDGSGHPLTAGSPLVFLSFQGYREVPFLNII